VSTDSEADSDNKKSDHLLENLLYSINKGI